MGFRLVRQRSDPAPHVAGKKSECDRACRGDFWVLVSDHRSNSRQPARRAPTLVGHPPNIRDWENREGWTPQIFFVRLCSKLDRATIYGEPAGQHFRLK
jgi:hypothetical protein